MSPRPTLDFEEQVMKNTFAVALASLASLPALASAAASHPITYPPGPTIWAFLAFLFGG